MFAYLNETGTNVIIDTEGQYVTFNEVIECLYNTDELNIENHSIGNLGNDCVGVSLLGCVYGLPVELNFSDRDIIVLNERGWDTYYLYGTSRSIWLEYNE